MRRSLKSVLGIAGVAGIATAIAGAGLPAAALPPSPCVVDCVVTFDVPGTTDFTIPAGAGEVSVTLAGGAGAGVGFPVPSPGGAGGAATIDLGSAWAGSVLKLTVGGTGEASVVADAGLEAIAVAGGGGGAGYLGRLDLPDQIFGAYEGGSGGAPVAPGVTAGTTPTAFGSSPANGAGATGAAGAGGSGDISNGTSGTAGVFGPGSTPGTAGTGGSTVVAGTTHTAGAGGSGYAGAGGGGISSVDLGDGILGTLVAPGGGGSGYLRAGLAGTAEQPNAGSGFVRVTWSFAPVVETQESSISSGDTVHFSVRGLPASAAFTLTFHGAEVAALTADAAGAASGTFVVPAGLPAGAFPVELLVGGTVVDVAAPLTVVVPAAAAPSDDATPVAELASTGPETGWPALVAIGAVLLGATAMIALPRFARR